MAFSLITSILRGFVEINRKLSFLDIQWVNFTEGTGDTAMITGEVSH